MDRIRRSNNHATSSSRMVTTFLVACLLVSLGINLCLPLFSSIGGGVLAPGPSRRFHQTASSLSITIQKKHEVPVSLQFTKEKAATTTTTTKTTSTKSASRPIHKPKTLSTPVEQPQQEESPSTELAGLSCAMYGGPSDEIAAEMVYWRDIPSDARYTSPFYDPHEQEEKFLLWDVDPAGWNNKRLSFENFLLLAHAMGRTLVMPPKGVWWGFSNDRTNVTQLIQDTRKKPRWSMADFYDIAQIAKEQDGLKVISMEEYLLQYAMKEKLHDRATGEVLFPPSNKTNWDDTMQKKLKGYLQKVTTQITWRPEDCLGAFPANNTDEARHEMLDTLKSIRKKSIPPSSKWIGRPNAVNASLYERMEEIITKRTSLCFYTPEQQQEKHLYYKILYDPNDHALSFDINIRLLIYFYCWMIFQDWKQDLWSKRFIRDHLRYKDELQCAAARIVHKLRTLSHDSGGAFDVLHIRRHGEFEMQYGELTTAEEIVNNIMGEIPASATVYIATDEPNRTFFAPLVAYFDRRPYFLDDFYDLIPGTDANYYSIIDQLIASRGRVFFGAFCSTFTGYINRLRGYHSTKSKWRGYKNGALVDSYFYNYNKEGKRDKMRSYHPPVSYWFFREYPLAWRDIDHDVQDKIVG